MDLALLSDARRARRAGVPRPPDLAVGCRAARRRYDAMTDVPQAAARGAREAVPFSTLTLEHEAHARDGTVKALFATADGRPVEAVLMRYRDGRRVALPLLPVGLPADVHVLRHRLDAVRTQPDDARRSSTRRSTSAASAPSTTRCSWGWASR